MAPRPRVKVTALAPALPLLLLLAILGAVPGAVAQGTASTPTTSPTPSVGSTGSGGGDGGGGGDDDDGNALATWLILSAIVVAVGGTLFGVHWYGGGRRVYRRPLYPGEMVTSRLRVLP